MSPLLNVVLVLAGLFADAAIVGFLAWLRRPDRGAGYVMPLPPGTTPRVLAPTGNPGTGCYVPSLPDPGVTIR